MMAILKRLNSKYFEPLTVPESCYLQLKFIGVRDDSLGQGIATSLICAALDKGASLGFRFAQTESAGARSQRVFDKMNFLTKAEIM